MKGWKAKPSRHTVQGREATWDGKQKPAGRDRGSTTVVAVGVMVAAAGLVAGLGLAGRTFLVKTHADGVADLAALAAADVTRGKAAGDPCNVAKKLVEKRNEMKMSECIARFDLGKVKVTVQADLPPPFTHVKSSAVAGGPSGT